MRLLIGSRLELTQMGGVSVVVRTLAKGCADSGDDVLLLKPGSGGPERTTVDSIPYIRLPLRSRWYAAQPIRGFAAFLFWLPNSLRLLIALLMGRGFDVVNLHYFDDAWMYVLWLKRLFRFRLVVSVHGDDVHGSQGPRNVRLLRKWASHIDRLVFCSAGFRDEVLTPADPLWAKSTVILNAVDVPGYHAVPATSRAARIVCVAHLFERKGIDTLVDAFAVLSEWCPGVELLIVGDGPERSSLEARVRRCGLSGRVTFAGLVDRARALELIRGASVFCLPSRREPFGLVLAEAMALRTPIVATRTGGIPEAVREGQDALLVAPNDPAALAVALRRVIEDPALAEQLTSSAFERWRTYFRTERQVHEYRRLFQTLVPLEGSAEARAISELSR
jgi:glycosyltransferase involved in cell wall biosynthesis